MSRYFQSLQRGRQKRLRRHQQNHWETRLVESLEDRCLLTLVDFSNMIAEVTASSDDGDTITAFLRGSATVDVSDTPTQTPDGRDVVQTEIVAMNLQGFDSYTGPLDVGISSIVPSLGAATERANVIGGQIDTASNVDSFFDVFLEIDAFVDDPMNPGEQVEVTLHGTAIVDTGTVGSRGVPVAAGDTMRLVQTFDLYLDAAHTMPAGYTVEELNLTFEADYTSIRGQKWNDLNGDGIKDAGEPGLDNWIVVAIDLESGRPVEAQVTRSIDRDISGDIDPDTEQGLYEFTDLPPGSYFITEMTQAGWGQTYPALVPSGEFPGVGPGSDWLQFTRQDSDFLSIGMLATFDWDNDGQGDEVVFLEGSADIAVGAYDGGSSSVDLEVGQIDLYGASTRGPVHIQTGDAVANNMVDGPLFLGGQLVQNGSDPALADSFFDILVQVDVGNVIGAGPPDPATVWSNSTAIHVEAEVDRLPMVGLPFEMTNGSPVPFFDSSFVQQAQLTDLRFTTFREQVFDETVGYVYEVTQGQHISNVLFGNRDYSNGPFGVDYGDAPAPYPTLAVDNGANHPVDGKHFLGYTVDAEDNGQPDPLAVGDDLTDPEFSIRSDDEDGVWFVSPLISGDSADIVIVGSPRATGQMLLSAWFDFDGNGSWADAGEQVFADTPIMPGENLLTIDIPEGLTDKLTYARFRVSTDSGLSFVASATNGEVEDYAVHIVTTAPPDFDWGDAPDPLNAEAGKYPTLAANNGAFHAIDGVTVIGNFVDTEADGQPSPDASGDDVSGVADDEDGIRVTQALAAGQEGIVEVSTLAGGVLSAWIDFNADGDWDDANERVADNMRLGPGRNPLYVTVPELADGTVLGPTFARFRLSPNQGEVGSPTGGAFNPDNPGNIGFGEVEDIGLTIYHGEVVARTEFWDVAVNPQELPPPADDSQPVVPVGISIFENDPDSDPSTELGGQKWYWFSVDGGPVQRLDELSLLSASTPAANQILLSYGDATDGDPIQVDISLTLNETSDTQADFSTDVLITNLTGSPIDVDFFAYSDLNLNGPLGEYDRATVVSTSQIDVVGASGSTVSDEITGAELPDHYEVATVLNSEGLFFDFQSGVLADLSDMPAVSTTTAPSDVAHAFQWSRMIGTAGTVTLQSTRSGEAVPVLLPDPMVGGSVSIGGTGGTSSTGGITPTGGANRFSGPLGPGITNPQRFDPALAIGYDFSATLNRFRSVELPSGIGDDQYMVSYLDDLSGLQTVALAAGVQLDFNADPNVTNGVTDFRVLGIETSAGIDVADPLGFVTQLSFVTATPYSISQTGIPEFIYVAEGVGELREDVNLGGMQGVLETGDEGTWLPGTEHEETGLTFGFTLFDSLTDAQNRIVTADYTGLTEIVIPPVDWGDAPDTGAGTGVGNYETLATDSGPSHAIVSGLFLGASIDGDDGTLQNATANADDVDGALPDDEDGVLNPLDLLGTEGAAPTVTLLVTNTTGTTATLAGWIDYNGDGVFDDSTERATAMIATGMTDARVTLTFPAIPGGSAGATYARFRLSTDSAFVAAPGSTGAADDGEVEDYVFAITASSDSTVDSSLEIASGTNGGPTLANQDYFGTAVAAIGDLDGDGVDDIAVSAPKDDTGGYNRGAVHVLLLNADGSVKSATKIASGTNGGPTLSNSVGFGSALANLGDLDGDGVTDLAVGTSGDSTGGAARGAVYVLLMNSDGTAKSSTKIASGTGGGPALSDSDQFGSSVAGLGDLDGDGVVDLAVGAISDDTGNAGYSNRGAMYVLLMNADGTAKSSTKIADSTGGGPSLADFDFFGSAVSNVGDLDGDGVADLAVGASGDDTGGANRGSVHVLFMNPDGTVKSSTKIAHSTGGGPTLSDFDYFGSSVAGVGDLDGDGIGDLAAGLIGAGNNQGAVQLLLLNVDGTVKSSTQIGNGQNGGPTLATNDAFGRAVTSLGDLDGDGVIDLAVGSPSDDTGGGIYSNRGAVYVLSLAAPAVPGPADVTLPGGGNYEALIDGSDTVVRVAGGSELFRDQTSLITSLTINGSAGDDSLTVDFSNGSPIPAGGLSFDGAGQNSGDVLALTGGTVTMATYQFDNANDGMIDLDGQTITFTGLEPITDNLSVTDRVFTYSSADDDVLLDDDGTADNNVSRITANGTAESVDFTSPSGSLTINAGAGDDVLSVVGADSMFNASITANGDAGEDDFNVVPHVTSTITVDGGTPTSVAGPLDRLSVDLLGVDTPQLTVQPDGGGILTSTTHASVTAMNLRAVSATQGQYELIVDTAVLGEEDGLADQIELRLTDYDLVPVAIGDLSTPDPFLQFYDAPAINNNGQAAFLSLRSGMPENLQGVFVADTNGFVTAGLEGQTFADGAFTTAFSEVSLADSGLAAFRATIELTGMPGTFGGGVFGGDGSSITTIGPVAADPFAGPNYFAGYLSESGTAVLSAGVSFGADLHINTGAGPVLLYDSSTLGPDIGAFFGPDINNSGVASAVAGASPGVFRFVVTGNGGALTTVADTNDMTDGLLGNSISTNTSINDTGTVTFVARADTAEGEYGVYTGNGGPLTLVADTTGEFGLFSSYGPSINDSGTVAFTAILNGGSRGLFTGPDVLADKVVADGDLLAGAVVDYVESGRFALNDSGEIAFFASLDDGREAIAIARPITPHLQVAVNGQPVFLGEFSGMSSITVNGSGDDDDLTVDTSSGDPIPDGGLTFNGGGQTGAGDALELNGPADTVTHTFTSSSSGSANVDGQVINYTGLEPIVDMTDAANRVFTFGGGDDEVDLGDGQFADDGIFRLTSVASSELLDFSLPTTSLTINLGAGADTLLISVDDLDGFVGMVTLNGDAGQDSVDASLFTLPVSINGGDDDDTLSGGSGNDSIDGGNGSDLIVQAGDTDFTLSSVQLVSALTGTDSLTSIDRAQLTGGIGNNTLDVSAFGGSTTLTGGDGNDTLTGSAFADNLTGNGGDDVVTGGGGNDTLNGGSGKDELIGGAGNDLVQGQGSTGDTLDGGDGDDTLNGGTGNDLIRETFSSDATLTNATMTGRGNDTVISAERALLFGSGAAQTIDVSAFFTAGLTSVTLDGGAGDDTLVASSGNDVVVGAGGSDRIDGGAGSDRLFGGSGADTLIGGTGDDLLKGLGGSGDRLSGGDGNDTINGGRGVDRIFETGDVNFTLTNTALTGLGTDVVLAVEVAELNGGPSDNVIDVSTFVGFKGFTLLRGNGGNDSIVGSAMSDVINGGDGNDTLLGKAGDDTLNGEDGNDGLSGFTGNDVIDGGRGYDRGFGGMGNDTLTGGNAIDTLIGGDGDDSINGNDGVDTLVGGTGNNDASPGDVITDATANIDEAFMLDPLPGWVDQV